LFDSLIWLARKRFFYSSTTSFTGSVGESTNLAHTTAAMADDPAAVIKSLWYHVLVAEYE